MPLLNCQSATRMPAGETAPATVATGVLSVPVQASGLQPAIRGNVSTAPGVPVAAGVPVGVTVGVPGVSVTVGVGVMVGSGEGVPMNGLKLTTPGPQPGLPSWQMTPSMAASM